MNGRIAAAGDAAFVLELGTQIDPATNARATAIARAFRAAGVPHVRDVVIGYCTVTVQFDAALADPDRIVQTLESLSVSIAEPADAEIGRTALEIPVCYGGEYGPDLHEVAGFAGVADEEVIRLHADRVYRVYMVGFVPGFPFLGTVETRIAMPRRETPRARVPARSVGIAGVQTGIYPTETPGGWRLIGRTSVQLTDPSRPAWCLLEAGDTVIFRAVDGPCR